MLCNMDKNSLLRSFSLSVKKDEELPDCQVLSMFSGYTGEFGPVSLLIKAELDSNQPSLICTFIQTSAEEPGTLFLFRIMELNHFINKILPLFNPLIRLPNEISQQTSQESQEL